MDQNALKMLAAKAALHYIEDGITLGVGSGSTVNCFIEALGAWRGKNAVRRHRYRLGRKHAPP